jgi:hypothetical protein
MRAKISAMSSTWTSSRMRPFFGSCTGRPRAASVMICTWSTEPRTLSGPVTFAGRTPTMDMP